MTKKLKLKDFPDLQSILNKIEELEKKIDQLIAKLDQPSFPGPDPVKTWPYKDPVPTTPNLQWRCNVCGLESNNGFLSYYCTRSDCPSGVFLLNK